MLESEGAARVHWLLVGDFGGKPSDARVSVGAARFAEVLAARGLEVEVELGPAFSGAPRGRLALGKLKDFSLQGAADGVAVLAPLAGLVRRLAAVDLSQRPGRGELLAELSRAYPAGVLSALVEKVWPAPAPAPAPAPGGSLLDQMLASPRQPDTPARAVDMLVAAARGAAPQDTSGTRAAHRALEAALYEAAAAALAAPEVRRLEGLWRGLRMLAEEHPQGSSMAVELLDARPADAAARIQATLAEEPLDRPDVIFLVEPVADPAALLPLGELAEELSIPLVVELSPAALGGEDPATLARALDDGAPLPPAWAALRDAPGARWLVACMNRVRVLAEGIGSAKRAVTAPAGLGLAALLAASYRASGAFVRMLRPEGALRAPAVDTLSSGPGAGLACPTEAFLSSSTQAILARAGVLALGSAKNSDQLRLSKAPTVSNAADAVELPAQIVTGRIVRFSQWIRDQIPAGAPDAEAVQLFEQAAGAFLFPGQGELAAVHAQVVSAEGVRRLAVTANIRPELAGTFLKLAFALKL